MTGWLVMRQNIMVKSRCEREPRVGVGGGETEVPIAPSKGVPTVA